ncbi:MAG TPA: hypothetical protein VMZ27_04480 [Candidatus Saccharimonadales bacterium]|nr:hypothetical protein [Candidatus Saccharimonadales bacterium]
MKVTEYKMVVATAVKINSEVNALIKSGWQPYGSPTVLPPTPELTEQLDIVFQAMVRTES